MTTVDTELEVPGPRAAARRQWRLPDVASIWIGIPLLVLMTVVVSQTMSDFNLFVFDSCLLAAMGAIALNFQLGTTGLVSMGNVAFLAVGSFSAVALSRAGMGFWPSVLIAAVVTGVAGVVIAIPAVRLSGLYFALATVAAFFLVYYIYNRYQTNTVGEAGFPLPQVFSTSTNRQLQISWAWFLTAVLAVVVLAASLITKGKVGRSLRTIRDHPAAAPAFGIPVVRYKLLAFGLASTVIGLQGALTAYYSGLVTIDSFTLPLSIQYLAMVIIGGLDSIAGAVIGAFVVTVLPTVTTNILQGHLGADAQIKGPQISLIVYGALIIVFVTSSAGGVAGWIRASRRVLSTKILSRRLARP